MELQAPTGYVIIDSVDKPNFRLINKPENISFTSYTLFETYKNKIYYNLPESGGIGINLFYVIGVLLLVSSLMLYIYAIRHKYGKKEN